jgi:hypothetical protein
VTVVSLDGGGLHVRAPVVDVSDGWVRCARRRVDVFEDGGHEVAFEGHVEYRRRISITDEMGEWTRFRDDPEALRFPRERVVCVIVGGESDV